MPSLVIHNNFRGLWESEVRYHVISGGRGSGKSFAVSTFLSELSFEERQKILFTRWTMKSAKMSIIPEFMEKIALLDETNHIANAESKFRAMPSEDSIKNLEAGTDILFRGINTSSGNQTANLKSINAVTTLVIEEAEELVRRGHIRHYRQLHKDARNSIARYFDMESEQ